MAKKYITHTNVLRFFTLTIVVFAGLTISTNSFYKAEKPAVKKTPKKTQKTLLNISYDDSIQVEKLLKRMTLKEKAGQVIFPWASSESANENSAGYYRLKNLVVTHKVGGLIFFKDNPYSEASTINIMQHFSDIPLLVSSDFERGLAMRLDGTLEYPYSMALAATGDLDLAYRMGYAVTKESRAVGVHQNYAPVSDINNNPNNPIINIRSFSEDKNIVSEFSKAFIKGTEDANGISTAKHFPGHGNTSVDSHQNLPVISGSKESLIMNELVPFVESINAGVSSIMVGHLAVPSIDNSNTPASLSYPVVTGLLKNQLGYKGLIVTDALNMRAITNFYPSGQAAVAALKAGVDIILMPVDEITAINSIITAVNSGEVSEGRLDESVRKILSAKKRLNLFKEKEVNFDNLRAMINSSEHLKLAEEVAKKSITLVKDENDIISLLKSNQRVSTITISEGFSSSSSKIFQNLLDNEYRLIGNAYLSKASSNKEYANALRIAKNSDVIIIPAFIKVKPYQGTVSLSQKNIGLIKTLIGSNKKVVLLSFGNPYLLSAFPEVKTYLCAYGDPMVSQQAMVNALLGKASITGKLPVSIPETNYKVGDGITKLFEEVLM